MINLDAIAIIAGQQSISYGEFFKRVEQFAAPMPGKDSKTIVFSENRIGWAYSFFAIWKKGGIAVPVDASSTVADVTYILRDCQPDALWVSREREEVARQAIAEAGTATQVFLIDEYEQQSVCETAPSSLLPWTALDEPDNGDTAVIIYTSGTTGSPKGVMLSYANLKANLRSVAFDVPIFTAERRTLVLLPLHHILPLMGTLIAPLYMGAGIAICPSLSGPDIMDTLVRGKIGIMVGVPRLWQTLYTGIKKKIDASALTRFLFALCSMVKCRTLSRLIFSSVRKKMGGHIDYCVSGGAALDREIGEGLRTIGLDVLEGYGMTETAPIIAFTRPGDYIPGCSGLPLPGVECKLVDGELCVKGPNLMKGYYNRKEETEAVIDADGFLHTGDLASFDDAGRITITGRTKEIIVLSNGKNVQPCDIEYMLEKYDSRVKEAAVVQDGDMLRAIIVPQPEWAAKMSDTDVAVALKREVLEPYNLTVSAYKKIMNVFVYRGDLPRTKLDKLQRFKLQTIMQAGTEMHRQACAAIAEPEFEEYQLIKRFIETEKGIEVHAADHIETDLALDSLDKVSLQGFIEKTFGTTVTVDAMPTFANVEALARYLSIRKRRIDHDSVDWHQLLCAELPELQLPKAGFSYRLLSRLFKGFFLCYNTLSIKGVENIPAKGACIIAPNHQSFLDGPLSMTGIRWADLGEYFFYATEEHVRGKMRRRFADNNNIILMERRSLKNSILKLARVLRDGHRIVIFPEGARTHDGALIPFKKAFAILAHELQVPIVPVCIRGAFEALPRNGKLLKPHHIEIEYLPPIMPTADTTYESLTKQVQNVIQQSLAN